MSSCVGVHDGWAVVVVAEVLPKRVAELPEIVPWGEEGLKHLCEFIVKDTTFDHFYRNVILYSMNYSHPNIMLSC